MAAPLMRKEKTASVSIACGVSNRDVTVAVCNVRSQNQASYGPGSGASSLSSEGGIFLVSAGPLALPKEASWDSSLCPYELCPSSSHSVSFLLCSATFPIQPPSLKLPVLSCSNLVYF